MMGGPRGVLETTATILKRLSASVYGMGMASLRSTNHVLGVRRAAVAFVFGMLPYFRDNLPASFQLDRLFQAVMLSTRQGVGGNPVSLQLPWQVG